MGVLLHVGMQFILVAALSGLAQPQADGKPVDAAAEQELRALFRAAPESSLRFKNPERAPVAIEQASIRIIRSDQVKSMCACGGAYLVQPKVTLINNSRNSTRSVTLEITDFDNGLVSSLHLGALEHAGSFVFNDDQDPDSTGNIERLSADSNPSKATVRVLEVVFDDGTVWEAEPSIKQPKVELEPIVIQMPAPRYTEEALQRQLEGRLRMHLLVGTDGKVKSVRVVSGLGYGLDEQGISVAYSTTFTPAVREGASVQYWVVYQIDFRIRAERRKTERVTDR
jgi:TonB family protein